MASRQVMCMKWGTLYDADYVNRLYSMVRRNVTGDLDFVCMTDDATGIREEVRCLPCPEVPQLGDKQNQTWRKLALWQPQLYDLKGEFLFLDLDIVVVDNIDDLFHWGEGFCVMRNWTQPDKRIGNTSVYRFAIGSHSYLWQRLIDDPDAVLRFANSQTYISHTVTQMSFFPDEWCRLFKVHCVPRGVVRRWFVEPQYPQGTKIVAFPGSPNPPQAAAGRWPAPWYKRWYKHIRPTRWIEEHWR